MKKLFFIAAMALTSLSASAQHQVGGVTLQPNLSMTLATVTDNDDNKMKVGIAAGAELEYQATEMLGLAGGVQYAMQGAKNDNDKLNLDYLNIPLRAKVYVAPGFSINAGVQFGFLLNSKWDVLEYFPGVKEKDILQTFDFSIPMGVSYEISNVVIDARYNLGVTDITKDFSKTLPDGSEIAVDSKARNSVFMLTVGYRFDL